MLLDLQVQCVWWRERVRREREKRRERQHYHTDSKADARAQGKRDPRQGAEGDSKLIATIRYIHTCSHSLAAHPMYTILHVAWL